MLLLILMMGIDFGRIFLGWVNLNNTARIASNFAANNALPMSAGNPAAIASYENLVRQDASATNCALPTPLPPPTYPDGTDLGDRAHVEITCQFSLFTPIISNVLGSLVSVSASSDFPVRTGVIAGTPVGPAVVQALFNVSPASGVVPQTVTFSDFSTGAITSYAWDFDEDGVVDSTTAGNQTFTYTIAGSYDVTLTVSDGLNTDSETKTVTMTSPPGPVVDFTALPASGTAPLNVTFTNSSTGTAPLTYVWDYGDASPVVTTEIAPDHSYGAGNWTVTLTVTDANGLSNSGSRPITVTAAVPMCTVPNFTQGNQQTSDGIQTTWTNAGFNTTVIFNPARPPEFNIKKQVPPPGSQPCSGTVLTLSKQP